MNETLKIKDIKEGTKIKYIGESMAYGGVYTTCSCESTYRNPEDCPLEERGKLVIIEFMNDDTPMFFLVENLNLNEWCISNE